MIDLAAPPPELLQSTRMKRQCLNAADSATTVADKRRWTQQAAHWRATEKKDKLKQQLDMHLVAPKRTLFVAGLRKAAHKIQVAATSICAAWRKVWSSPTASPTTPLRLTSGG
eukprot:9368066-Prorocentrum_lima.AAC.1